MTIKTWQSRFDAIDELYRTQDIAFFHMQQEIDELRASVANLKAYAKYERSLGAEPFAIENNDLRQEIDDLRAALAETKQVLEEFDALIRYQYTGTREAMSDLTYVAQHCAAVLKKHKETP